MTHLRSKTTSISTSRRRLAVLAGAATLLAIGLAAGGCGDDDPPPAPADPRINFPGDAMTLQAAINMASAGDTVLVGAGTHSMDETLDFGADRSGVVLVGRLEGDQGKSLAERPALDFSEAGFVTGVNIEATASGVTIRGLTLLGTIDVGVQADGSGSRVVDCRIEGDPLTVACISSEGADSTVIIEGNLLLDAGLFGISCSAGAKPQVIGNTIVSAGDCGILSSNAAPSCRANIIVGSANWGVACSGPLLPVLSCNDLFDNGSEVSGGNYQGTCLPGSDDIHADPLFCDALSYALAANSPCSADSAGACGQIGAVGVGCAAR